MPHSHNVTITSMGALTPLGDAASTWRELLSGKVAFSPAGRNRPFVAAHCAIPSRDESLFMRRCLSLALEATRGLKLDESVDASRRALVFASTKGELDQWELQRAMRVSPMDCGVLLSELARELASRLGIAGRVLAVSTACCSGAQAIIEAAEMLEDGDCDEAVVIGADSLSLFIEHGFGALQAVSRTGARPFDAARDGLTLGEAGAAVVLSRAGSGSASARPRLIAWGGSNDANHISGPCRDGSGLALAIERALKGLDKSRVAAICAHGTATRFNDAMEAHAFKSVFDESIPPVFSIKGNLGHTLGAAGVLELIVSAQCAQHGLAPPTAGFERQSQEEPKLDIVHIKPRLLERGYILSTNSGFGGMNTALVVEAP
ncbi:3-oxoacyl-[acyl-carrier-protein] synthase I [Planctomycetaceae bacterium]|nr:3-oxoacyl-[acyl-carrier-protein] synthase I [Planctomycetaceae bacterium]